MKIEKYICNSCGVSVKQSDWEVVIRREKMCIECCGEVEMTDETLRRIELKNNPIILKVTTKNSKNKLENLSWSQPDKNTTLRREPVKKKKSKKKEPSWKRYRDY